MIRPFPRMPLPPDLTFEFIGAFARLEFALKCAGFARGNETSVEADWDAFARHIDSAVLAVSDPAFRLAVHFMINEPPRKQGLELGRLVWVDAPPDGNLPLAEKTLLMVRRVRNNLFHGAKMWSPEYNNGIRDVQLVTHALTILLQCASLDGPVSRQFGVSEFLTYAKSREAFFEENGAALTVPRR